MAILYRARSWLVRRVTLKQMDLRGALMAGSLNRPNIVIAPAGSSDAAAAIALLALPIIGSTRAIAVVARWNGQTLGERLPRIRVINRDGGDDIALDGDAREAVARHLLFGDLGLRLVWSPSLLDYPWPTWDLEDRTVHDVPGSTER